MIEFEWMNEWMVHFHYIGFKMFLIDLYNLHLILLLTTFTNEKKLFSDQSDFNWIYLFFELCKCAFNSFNAVITSHIRRTDQLVIQLHVLIPYLNSIALFYLKENSLFCFGPHSCKEQFMVKVVLLLCYAAKLLKPWASLFWP